MPSIYVASLSDYNSGILHGVWIDLEGKTADDVQEEVADMLKASPSAAKGEGPAEEWRIDDYEGFPKGYTPGPYDSFEDIIEVVAFMGDAIEHVCLDAAQAWLDNGMGLDIGAFQEAYHGRYVSLGHWAEEFHDETGEVGDIPAKFRPYIDWDAMGRDAELNGDIWSAEVGYKDVHVFWSR